MRIAPVVACLLLLTACSKKKNDAPAADQKPTAAAPGAPAAPPAAAAGSKLDCDKIFPKELRDKYFAGWEITDNPQPVAIYGECKVKKGEDEGIVNVGCHDNIAASIKPSIDAIKGTMTEAKDLPGVGKAAIIIDPGKIGDKQLPIQVTAWDDNSNCNVHLSAPAGVDATALAKDMIAFLPPK